MRALFLAVIFLFSDVNAEIIKIKCVYDFDVNHSFTFEFDTEELNKVNKYNRESVDGSVKIPSFMFDGDAQWILTAKSDGSGTTIKEKNAAPYVTLGDGIKVTKNSIFFKEITGDYHINRTSGSGYVNNIWGERMTFQCDKWDGQKKF